MEDPSCYSLFLRELEGLEEAIVGVQRGLEGLIKGGRVRRGSNGNSSFSVLLPLVVMGVELASLIPDVKDEVKLLLQEEDFLNEDEEIGDDGLLTDVKEEVEEEMITSDDNEDDFLFGEENSMEVSDDDDVGDLDYNLGYDEESTSEQDDHDTTIINSKNETRKALFRWNLQRDIVLLKEVESCRPLSWKLVAAKVSELFGPEVDRSCAHGRFRRLLNLCKGKNFPKRYMTRTGVINEQEISEIRERMERIKSLIVPLPQNQQTKSKGNNISRKIQKDLFLVKEIENLTSTANEGNQQRWEEVAESVNKLFGGHITRKSAKHRFKYLCQRKEDFAEIYCKAATKEQLAELRDRLENVERLKREAQKEKEREAADPGYKVVKNQTMELEQSIPSKGPFICSTCGKEFRKKAGLKLHLGTHMPSSIQCTLCGDLFKRKWNFNLHLRFVHSKGEYKCDQCPKLYPRPESLQKHKESVHEGRKILCTLCGKFFRQAGHLKKHVLFVHQQLRRFPCHLCPKAFKAKPHLAYHLKTHENPGGRKRGLNRPKND